MAMINTLRAGLVGAILTVPVASVAAPADAAAPMFALPAAAFVESVTSANAFEIRSSELAREKATSADVKAYAEQMIADHTKAQEELNAASGGAAGPAEPKAPKHAAMIALLQTAEGPEFEALYIDMQAGAHMEAVSLLRTFAGSGDDPALVEFAKTTLPALEMHKMQIGEIVAAH